MATGVIMPALEMAQESGVLVSWLKREGESVSKGEPLMEIETDKVTVEIEAPASGFLGGVRAKEGDVVPVGQTIAWILAEGEQPPASAPREPLSGRASTLSRQPAPGGPASVDISPLARRIAEEHGIDPARITTNGKRIEKADVLAYLKDEGGKMEGEGGRGKDEEGRMRAEALSFTRALAPGVKPRVPASPKARRLAAERGVDITMLEGSGPEGAVLAADVPLEAPAAPAGQTTETLSTAWRVMAERMTASWTTVPHFYLVREVDASGLVEWRSRVSSQVETRSGVKPTYTDLLIKLIGAALRSHPRLNAAWKDGTVRRSEAVNVGIAVAVEDGLIVPVIRHADAAAIGEIARQRRDLVERAQSRKLRPADIADGTFTLSNLGMYNVDAFNAIINTPQAAILAVGRIAERVVPWQGQVAIRPTMVLTLSCDHRVADGARAAQFLDELAGLIEDPWRLLV